MVARRRRLTAPEATPSGDAPPENVVAAAPVSAPVKQVGATVQNLGQKGQSDTSDVLALYEAVSGLKEGPVTIDVKRITGTPTQTVIESQPQLGSGLYRELQRFHGRSPEAEYEVSFRTGQEPRGVACITMPAEDQPQQQGQVMPNPWPQSAYQQSLSQQPTTQQAPPQQPPPAAPAPGASPMDMWAAFQAMQRQQLDLLQEMQRAAGAQHSQPPVQPPPMPLPPPPPPPPAVPPPGASPMDQWSMFQAMQRQQLELLQEMQ